MDVHVTVQTPTTSLVLTTGCFHQILNLTAVEGWSCNFLPPCMIEVVNRVREERDNGWWEKETEQSTAGAATSSSCRHWNYEEGVSLLSLCWNAVHAHVIAASGSPTPLSTDEAIVTRSAVSTRVIAAVEPALPLPQEMQRACAAVLLPAIQQEQQYRQLIFTQAAPADPAEVTTAPRVERLSRKRGALAHGTTSTDASLELPFRLPLPRRPPPRTDPELCPFCRNLAFFAAVYAAVPEVNSAGMGASTDAATAPAHTYQLSCTGCLAKYVRLRDERMVRGDAKKRRTSTGISARVRSHTATKVSTFSEAGRLPSATERQRQFERAFVASLQRHATYWQRAYIGERCSDELMKATLLIAQQIMHAGR